MGNKINRRELLGLLGGAALNMAMGRGYVMAESLSGALCSESSGKKRLLCSPRISGPLWFLDPAESATWSMDRWRDELDEQHKLGFDLLWFTYTAGMLDIPGDPLGKLLDLCAKRKVQVMMDAGWKFSYATLDLKGDLEHCSQHVKVIGERYAGHPAFYSWYIGQEVYMCWGKFAEYIDGLYSGIVERCKAAAQLPVALSPFFILDDKKVFGDFRYAQPEEYGGYYAKLIKKSGLDIVMLQDSGEHFSFTTNEQRRPFFRAMQAACKSSGAKLWGNVETAEALCPSMEEYIRLYGRVHHSKAEGLPWRAVPIDRLKDKLELASEYSERIVCWGYREYCRPALGPEAKKWYDDYRKYYEKVRLIG
ncbi:MAG: DUF4434 domain-containing protein [Armatimonadota bacterium]